MADDPTDLMNYRLAQFEKRAEVADARMDRIEDKLTAIQVTLAGMATKDSIRNWGLAVMATIIATGVVMDAIMLQASGNRLSAELLLRRVECSSHSTSLRDANRRLGPRSMVECEEHSTLQDWG